jgi:hypothetical protein
MRQVRERLGEPDREEEAHPRAEPGGDRLRPEAVAERHHLGQLRANPALGFRRLFTGALGVGHDHIAATVNTLVFAYAGASLPVLLIFSIGGTTFTDAINSESVAEEVVATLVGSIGLIASMPITTAIAALLALKLRDRELGEAHLHAH